MINVEVAGKTPVSWQSQSVKKLSVGYSETLLHGPLGFNFPRERKDSENGVSDSRPELLGAHFACPNAFHSRVGIHAEFPPPELWADWS